MPRVVVFMGAAPQPPPPQTRRAAVTLHAIRETDMFELISSQVENKSLIEELIDQYIGNDGNVLPVKRKKNEGQPEHAWRQFL